MSYINDRMKELDKRMERHRRDLDKRIEDMNDRMNERLKEVQRRVDEHQRKAEERIKRTNSTVYRERNEAQEWTKRRVLFPKKCIETGVTIKPFQPAYFKDRYEPRGELEENYDRIREWVSEEAYTWKVLKDDA